MRKLWLFFALLSLPVFGQQRTPEPLQRTDPSYSDEALVAGLEGTVQLAAEISADGSLHDVHVTRPLGLGLDEQALAAVAQWKFAPATTQPANIAVPIPFNLPSKLSRWHLIGAHFDPPEGVERPVFLEANYPRGPGISPAAYEEGRLIGAIGRPANVTLGFEIDDRGKPERFEIVKSSYEVWGIEAANLVSNWQFAPGTKEGKPVPVHCTLDLVWGAENLSDSTIAQQLAVLHPPPPRPPAQTAARSKPAWVDPPPLLIDQDQPAYTEQARAAGLEGIVRVRFQIDPAGQPQNVELTQPPLGLGLDQQAVQTISQWRFQPGPSNANATYLVEIHFQLSGVTSLEAVPPKAAPLRK